MPIFPDEKRVSYREWLTIGIKYYGDQRDWRFVCHLCGHVQSYREVLAEKPELEGNPLCLLPPMEEEVPLVPVDQVCFNCYSLAGGMNDKILKSYVIVEHPVLGDVRVFPFDHELSSHQGKDRSRTPSS